jgi:toluene monooxygenase system ferredoxin subunit
MAWRRVLELDSLWSGEMVGVAIEGRRVLLVHCDGQVFAYEDRCAHLGVPLRAGRLAGQVLTCAAHEWSYDVPSGCGINPRKARLKSFPVEVRDGAIWVNIDGDEKAGQGETTTS